MAETNETETAPAPQVDPVLTAADKAALREAHDNRILDGVFLAHGPDRNPIFVRAESNEAAAALLSLYLGQDAARMRVSGCKAKVGPKPGDRVLRAHPTGYVYGTEPKPKAPRRVRRA
jgi:hypothetical protein